MRKGVKLKLPIAVCLLAGINACMVCPEDEVFYQIGKFASRDEALRAAIPELAKIIRKCPQARTYRVVFTAPGVYRVDRHALLYFRNNGATKIGYEDDLFSGISPDFGLV
ncbi:MAG TPA: hypothetical protein VKN18_17635 [Blastocatellia bacterium]|nr:hypothetical protein [Blastocatellia bacterium]